MQKDCQATKVRNQERHQDSSKEVEERKNIEEYSILLESNVI